MFTEEQIKALEGLSTAFKNNPHGSGGLFDGGPLPGMPSSIERSSDLSRVFSVEPSNFEDTIFEVFTDITDPSGSNPEDNCGTPPTPGQLKVARQTFPFGEFYMATEEINITDGNLRRDMTDTDRQVLNPIIDVQNPFVPAGPDGTLNPNTLTGKRLLELGRGASRAFEFVHVQGLSTRLPAAARLGFISEYNGIDQQIATGKTDSVSGVAAPGLDSYVNNTGTNIGADTVNDTVNMVRSLRMRADYTNLGDVRFQLVVNPRMKHELFDVWACNFATVKCNNTAGDFDLMTINQRRIEMSRGSYVMVDGIEVPVIGSWGVDGGFNASNNNYTSDIYCLPINGTGGVGSYNRFFFQPMGTGEMVNMMEFAEVRQVNNGLYLSGKITNRPYCFQYTFTGKFRAVLQYPFLCGRVDNVTYNDTADLRGPAFDGGGVTART